jgi:toxin CcdB
MDAKIFPAVPRLSPVVAVEGESFMVLVTLLAAVPRKFLGPVVTSLSDRRDDLIAALDMLFTGI